jgi:hypothetical protein
MQNAVLLINEVHNFITSSLYLMEMNGLYGIKIETMPRRG